MKIPVRNIINMPLEKAKTLLNGYKIKEIEVNDSAFLDNYFTYYQVDEINEIVTLYVNNRLNNSFTLDKEIKYINNLGFVTGEDSINKELFKKSHIGSTDLGICIDNKDNCLFLYGDSFSGKDCNKGMWNSNFIAKSINKDFSNNIYFKEIISYDNNLVKPIIQGQHDENLELNLDINNHKEVTKIPTGGIRINDDVYVFYMSVRYWGKPGEWFVTENQLLKAKYYDLKNFKKVENVNFKCSDSEQFGQIFPFLNKDDEDYIYLLANPGGRFGNTCLLKVKKVDIENKDKYLILTKNKEFKSLLVTNKDDYFYILNHNHSSEGSIIYNPYLHKWVISNLDEDGINFYLSDSLLEEFKEKIKVINSDKFPLLYGGFINECMMDNDGKRMFMQVSQWSPIYNTSLFEIVFN